MLHIRGCGHPRTPHRTSHPEGPGIQCLVYFREVCRLQVGELLTKLWVIRPPPVTRIWPVQDHGMIRRQRHALARVLAEHNSVKARDHASRSGRGRNLTRGVDLVSSPSPDRLFSDSRFSLDSSAMSPKSALRIRFTIRDGTTGEFTPSMNFRGPFGASSLTYLLGSAGVTATLEEPAVPCSTATGALGKVGRPNSRTLSGSNTPKPAPTHAQQQRSEHKPMDLNHECICPSKTSTHG